MNSRILDMVAAMGIGAIIYGVYQLTRSGAPKTTTTTAPSGVPFYMPDGSLTYLDPTILLTIPQNNNTTPAPEAYTFPDAPLGAFNDFDARENLNVQQIARNITKQLLDYIAAYEAPDYNTISRLAKTEPPRPLTQLQIREVLDWQRENENVLYNDRRLNGSAAGRYQIIRATLERMPLDQNTIFNAATQDACAEILLNERGFAQWLSGSITTEIFADNLSKEWASLPYNTGRSYYSQNAIDKAGVSRNNFILFLNSLR